MSSSSPASQFGPNEWLVEEMYDQFLADPSSVDAAWHDFFADFKPTQNAQTKADNARQQQAGAKPATNGQATAPSTKAVQNAESAAKQTSTPATTTAPAKPAPKPAATAASASKTAPKAASTSPAKTEVKPQAKDEPESKQLRGAAAAIAKNMDASLSVPTATSVRAVPAKLMADNRIVINNHLKRTRGGKISFTHLIGFAMVRALKDYPNLNRHYQQIDGKPFAITPEHVNFGLAIDMKGKDGSRNLVVASVKNVGDMSFLQFWQAYEDIVKKARNNKLTADDFAGTTISLTNPGGIGTNHSVPRLQAGQGAIIGVGAMQYPAAFEGTSEKTLVDLGISKIMTLTSTYDHRIIQGAESGEFLKRIHQLLLGEDGFYDDVFTSLRLPYEPIRWVADIPEGPVDKTARVIELIDAFRMRGHLMADTDPLNYRQRSHADLDVLSHGLTLWDLDREFPVGGFAGQERMKLRDILGVLRNSYCRTVGIEYTHILDPEERRWIQERVEIPHEKPDPAVQKYVLSKLNAAEAFETFLQTKYVGQKRFSLEGGETAIPLLDTLLDKAAEHELDEVVIGMPHRGRLNVLANIVGKPISQIFQEFEGNLDPGQAHGSGDVKYHLGAEGKYFRMFGDGETKVSLTANPSHLETVDPVLEGIVRAKQDLLDKGGEGYTVLPVLMHGDAAFAGQGVVAETLNLSLLRGYRTGGTVHVIVNNQVGFTTAPEHSRSSQYATDVAKMIGSPIFHVNGDDPEAAHWVAKLAVEYRQAFHKDVVIDLICYRRRGHNEGDDPSMTQPAMYDIIDTKRSVRKGYTESLIGRGDISVEEAEAALRDFSSQLEHVFNEVRELEKHPAKASPSVEEEQQVPAKVTTSISSETLEHIGDAFVNVPEGFTPHPRVKPVMERRHKMSREGDIDWAFGELLAFGSLALEGRLIRLSGQDSRRGTFTQRHSVFIDRKTGQEYSPLQNLADGQGRVMIYDSALSEYAAVGFEYGYSVANSEALVMWEAQFGDFVNGAQTVIDEYISSGEAKWGQRSDVVLLLPHGHEGQGPDHTSGRIERFLALCAEGSMTVAVPSTPANYFHLLRRHALDGIQRPLVVFTPKSMLRNKAATSATGDFTGQSRFMSVIDDVTPDPAKVRKVLLTSGKLYWELVAERTKREADDVAIVRIEQYYPLPKKKLLAALERYTNATQVAWVQEEPENQGGWPFFGLNLPRKFPEVLSGLQVVSRRPMAAPSAGSSKVHEVEQKALISKAFD
ncbi:MULTISPECIES: multifunctional oxoglutarate decarboxylase/oxoglutarate dehydrogenase thiamine pyrophosphate-binding subunit/dihydrolipoyllysine-residue succinyltransferase subunit [unclassified Amycolatopsis]|uniref:multifunctional oxoglutarate decarboxylase/oxoglutarate dehydrogenase thiamine pyrophosphate-binding subunit/dihydrolipoyllysine-residue succinyltransferase subunit n=1 Tax=unclassified Amycolatopsis TaxID=2618356 RepID=UPI002E15518F|nr:MULTISPECIES: multifunctional oxoglutarate decarboxylase/oxoglutarate dehydrogenase thiamine pyrophosphate-binding subunit/dihydrolipoyllysine-residue succinyltransferase subunit [unclassified Amycolatopsis]WSJ73839.1 multifunctional oxoglutarate decarboxylase/oxoglutarate dehydrogenase thiamine pyrophosphate-binding subunit/dihydrolipoyllysine-residue succinyltransferase subunit [Amycolatopsis sp. NBC_01307]WSK82505.1 multifunctional oxoglutarate decarboxylase/oxoglutarate dehydrogenase thiam